MAALTLLRRAAAPAALFGLLVLFGPPAAQALTDPMRPGGATAAAPAPAQPGNDGARHEAPEAVLQATRRDPQGRWTALLGNLWLGVGEQVDDARIVSISESDVVLLRGSQRIALTLLPVRTTPSAPGALSGNASRGATSRTSAIHP